MAYLALLRDEDLYALAMATGMLAAKDMDGAAHQLESIFTRLQEIPDDMVPYEEPQGEAQVIEFPTPEPVTPETPAPEPAIPFTPPEPQNPFVPSRPPQDFGAGPPR